VVHRRREGLKPFTKESFGNELNIYSRTFASGAGESRKNQ